MSPQAKYSWGVGLIIIGLMIALPFRKSQEEDSTAQSSETANEVVEGEKVEVSALASTPKPESNLSNSPLLPNADQLEMGEKQVVSQVSPPSVTPQQPAPMQMDSALVQQAPVIRDDRPASLSPVDFSQAKPQVDDPYRMQPVPNSRFFSASQSSNRPVYSTASSTRRVIHYRLRDGDTLRSIAKRYLGDASRYEQILVDNPHVLTNGENYLPIGQYITVIAQ